MLLGTLGNLAMQGLSYGINQATAQKNNEMSYEMAKKQAALNHKYNEMAAENAYKRQLQYYGQTQSAQARLQDLKEAGLSPSLMGSGAFGTGGGSTPQGGGASGQGIQTYGIQQMNPLDLANLELIKAQTRKTNAEADTEGGENDRGQAEIEKLKADIQEALKKAGAAEAESQYTKALTTYQNLNNTLKEMTISHDYNRIVEESKKAMWDAVEAMHSANNAGLEFKWNEETFEERKKQLSEQTKLITQNMLTSKATEHLTKEQANAVQHQVNKWYLDVYNDYMKNNISAYTAYHQKNYWEKQIATLNKQIEQSVGVQKETTWIKAIGGLISSMIVGGSMLGSTAMKLNVMTPVMLPQDAWAGNPNGIY